GKSAGWAAGGLTGGRSPGRAAGPAPAARPAWSNDISMAGRALPYSGPGLPRQQVAHQRLVERHAGVQRDIVDTRPDAVGSVLRAELLHFLEVVGLDRIGVDLDDLPRLVVLKPDHPLEGELRLRLVQDVEYDQIMAGESQPVDRPEDRFGLAEQVAEDHDQAAVPEHARDLVQARLDLGGPLRPEPRQQRQDVAQLRTLATRRQALRDLLVEGDQPDRVLLVDHQVAQRRRQADAVLELGQFLPVSITHGTG